MRRLLLCCCLLLPALWAEPGATAADPAAATEETGSSLRPIGGLGFADEVEVTVVNVMVHVNDKDGKPVTDLTRDDFKLFQDGEQRPITNFELLTEQPAAPAVPSLEPIEASATEQPDQKPYHLVLYIDNQNLHPLHRNRVLTQAREFVTENLHEPVRMMVVSYQRSLKVVEPFTADPRVVLDALRSLRSHTGGYPARVATKHEILDEMQEKHEEAGGSAQIRDTRQYQYIYSRILSFADEEHNDLSFSLDALRGVISMIAGLPGRKGVVYIANGLPMVPGLDLFTAFAELYNDHAIYGEMSRYDRSRLFQSLVAAANAQDVTFYTIGAGGLEVSGLAAAQYRSAQAPLTVTSGHNNDLDSLRFMAEETGGIAVVNSNGFREGFTRIARDITSYYSLGYSLTMSGADKVHRVKVELTGKDRGYRLRFRERVVERSLQTQVQDRVLTGLMFDLDENPMQLECTSGEPAPASQDRWMLPVHVSFPVSTVALLPQGEDYIGTVVLFVAARDNDGKQSDMVRQEHPVTIPAGDYEQAQHQRFGIDLQLLMESGSYRIAVGMLDQLTRQASYQTLETRIVAR